MVDRIKIAGVQMDPQLMKPKENLARIIDALKAAAAVRADQLRHIVGVVFGLCPGT